MRWLVGGAMKLGAVVASMLPFDLVRSFAVSGSGADHWPEADDR